MSFQQILGRKPENFRDYMQATGQFIFGGNTGDTYETLQQKRQVAGRLAANASRAPKTAGEGLTALGQAIAYRRLMNQANEGEKAGQEDFNEQFQSLFGGAAPMAAPASAVPGSPMSGPTQPQVTQAVASGDDPYAVFNASLARTESGGNYNITNSEGFGGKYQFGQPRLDDFNRAMGTNYRVADLTAGSPEAAALTEAVQRWHIGDIDNFVTDNGLDRYLGQNIGGVTMTQNGLRAMAHLGGTGGMRRFLTSGGRYNPSDSNGTSLLDYARTHAGGAAPSGPGAMPSAPTGGGIDPRLLAMLDNPYATNGQRAVMQLMLQRQMAANAPPDPMQALQMRQAQLGIERSQLELDRLRNPSVDPMQQIELERAQIELEQLRNPDRETKVVDGRLIDAQTGEVLYSPEDGGTDFDTEQKLRKEFTGLPTVKDFSSINDAWDRVQASAADPSPAGDLALIFNYMKMLDPGSVVREGEFATAQNAGSVDDRVWGMYNRILSGERLTPEQRGDFMDRAGQMFNAQAGNFNDAAERYRGLATQYGLQPDRIAEVVELYQVTPEEAAQALAGGSTPATTPAQPGALPPPPDGIDASIWPDVWKHLTPEERKHFQ